MCNSDWLFPVILESPSLILQNDMPRNMYKDSYTYNNYILHQNRSLLFSDSRITHPGYQLVSFYGQLLDDYTSSAEDGNHYSGKRKCYLLLKMNI